MLKSDKYDSDFPMIAAIVGYTLGLLYAIEKAILIIGTIFIVADLYINKMQEISSHALLYIGIFSCMLGIWCSTSTHIIELLTNY